MSYYVGHFTQDLDCAQQNGPSSLEQQFLSALLQRVQMHRFHTAASFRELLIRLLLIHKAPLSVLRLNLAIGAPILEFQVGGKRIELSLEDLLEWKGYGRSSFEFNIEGSLEQFIQSYRWEPVSMMVEEEIVRVNLSGKVRRKNKAPHFVTSPSLDNLFHADIRSLPMEHLTAVIAAVEEVMEDIPSNTFPDYLDRHPEMTIFEERYRPELEFGFDMCSQLDLDTVCRIIERTPFDDGMAAWVREQGLEATRDDLSIVAAHVSIAYGIKHGLIQLDGYSIHEPWVINPYFDFDLDALLWDDHISYSPREIYDIWNMADWMDLLAETPAPSSEIPLRDGSY